MYSKEDQLRGKSDKKSRQPTKQTDKLRLINQKVSLAIDEIDQEREPCCEECGINQFDHSHLIPRAFGDYAYSDIKENIRRQCREHHVSWEQGRLYLLPKSGEQCLLS